MLNNSRTEIKGVIFDFDNTLVDTASAINKAYDIIFSEISRDFSIDKNELYLISKKFLKEKQRELSKSKASYDHGKWVSDIARMAGLNLSKENDKYEQMFYKYFTDNPIFSRNTESILKDLKQDGIKLALLSDKDSIKGMKMERVMRLPFVGYFDQIVIAGETVPFRKSDGKIVFEETADRLGLKSAEIIAIGDRLDLDIQNAKEAGMEAVLFTGYSKSTEYSKYDPDFTVNDMQQLRKVLFNVIYK